MKTLTRTSTVRRPIAGLAALALASTFALGACGSDADDTAADSTSTSATTEGGDDMTETPMETPSEDMSQDASGDPASQTFGAACDQVPTSGDGSFDGMATAPVATAASANPLLKTLVKAVTQADLVDTLNSADGITVFAPTNDAFAEIPPKKLKAVLADKQTLSTILTHHVVAGQLTPDDLAAEHETLAGDMLTVEGSGEDFSVGAEGATVLCGNIPTANATVYVIDKVLMPSM